MNPNPLLPDGVSKTFINSSDRQTVNRIKRHILQTCRFQISEQYIQRAFNNFKKGFIYQEGGTLLGFCIWKEKNAKDEVYKAMNYTPPDEKYMEILLLCSIKNDMRLGTHMLDDIDSYCVDSNIKYVNLEPSDDNTMLFYEKNGYRVTSPPYERKRVMTKHIESFKIRQSHGSSTRRVKRTMRNTIQNTQSQFKSMTRREFFSLSPEEARRVMNYNVDLSNAVPRSP